MKLEDLLEEAGYNAHVRELEEFRRVRDMLRENLAAGKQPNVPITQVLADLAELEIGIKTCEKALADELAAAIRRVDSENDLDLDMESVKETLRLFGEYVQSDLPEHYDEIRHLLPKDD